MVQLFYTSYISVDLAQQEIFRAKIGKGGIKPVALRYIQWIIPTLFYKSEGRIY